MYCAGANARQGPVTESLSPGVELAWWNGAADGQAIGIMGGVKINIEAYNRKREKDIADESRKLLSLAIALKSDLDRNSGPKPSANAVDMARQIEKLAHAVKESMKLNLIGPR